MPRNFPVMFDNEELQRFKGKTYPEEIKSILKSFAADKNSGSDGWTSDFFLHFYEDFILDLTDMVEEARVNGRIHGAINSTFIALIPKGKGKVSFNEYRPISLCNTL